MAVGSRIREHRPTLILAVLIGLSLASLASGAHGGRVATAVHTIAGTASRPFLKAMNVAQGSVAYLTGILFDYNAVREDNQTLRRTFGTMLQHVSERNEIASENNRLRAILDFERSNPRFTLQPVEVLQHSGGLLTIDRGAIHGMRESMCVVSADGVIGILTRVDLITSIVATLQDPECKIDAMIRRNRVRGTVHGSSSDLTRICDLHYVELKHDVREGDEVVTSPDSIFPAGFPIGAVVSVEHDPGSLWKSAGILPAADPFNIDEVLVIVRADTDWREMAGGTADSASGDLVHKPLQDALTAQERYAP